MLEDAYKMSPSSYISVESLDDLKIRTIVAGRVRQTQR